MNHDDIPTDSGAPDEGPAHAATPTTAMPAHVSVPTTATPAHSAIATTAAPAHAGDIDDGQPGPGGGSGARRRGPRTAGQLRRRRVDRRRHTPFGDRAAALRWRAGGVVPGARRPRPGVGAQTLHAWRPPQGRRARTVEGPSPHRRHRTARRRPARRAACVGAAGLRGRGDAGWPDGRPANGRCATPPDCVSSRCRPPRHCTSCTRSVAPSTATSLPTTSSGSTRRRPGSS